MAKIRVSDIAKKMKVPEQDLIFKLKSIGVRVEGEDAQIDTEVIQALLSGKTLPQAPQQEVIMRDAKTPAPAAPKKRPPRRQPAPPPRPNRRRPSIVQKADKIRTLPSSKPKEEPRAEPPAEAIETQAPAPAPAAAKAKSAPAKPAGPRSRARVPEKKRAIRNIEVRVEDRSLEDFRGSVDELEAAEQADAEAIAESNSRRRRRRASRKEEAETANEQGRIVSSRDPEGGVITISEGMRVRDLAEKLGVRAKDLMKTLMGKGVIAGVNHTLDPQTALEVAEELGFDAMVVSFEEEVQLQREAELEELGQESSGKDVRAPVITVMGHVDHGKTSLLDAIRASSVAEGESGGITQHIAAYKVDTDNGDLVFLDTPGHEAFTQLRARGARVTDIVILVVAADDGVMPQTIEAIDHARAAKVPILVAINKMDRDNANPDRVKKELAERELLAEDWGGETVMVPVSAIKKEGVDDLLEMINLTAEMAELRADASIPAQASVIEARKEAGRGVVATILVQTGTLRIGDAFVCGSTWGRVRSLSDDRGERIKEAGPSTPVEVTGLNDLPAAGDALQVVAKESKARDIAELRAQEERQRELAPTAGRMSLENLLSNLQEGEVKELPVVVKADVQGSVEVLKDTLQKTSTEQVKVNVIHASAGAVSTNDVLLASASGAIIYGFNVRPERNASELAAKESIEIRTHTVIYELIDELKAAMAGLLEPTIREVEQGRAEVREIFKVPRIGMVAGCHVIEGVINRNDHVRLLRDNVVVHEGKIGSLRRFKDDASEVRSGFDCGIGIDRFQDVKPGDLIEAFTHEEVAATL
ncbi:MAG: translation initiation factor IF-2 [Acidobacteriota bacterium]